MLLSYSTYPQNFEYISLLPFMLYDEKKNNKRNKPKNLHVKKYGIHVYVETKCDIPYKKWKVGMQNDSFVNVNKFKLIIMLLEIFALKNMFRHS